MYYIKKYDGKGFAGLLAITYANKDYFAYTMRPDIIKENKFNMLKNRAHLFHGIPKIKKNHPKVLVDSIEYNLFYGLTSQFLGDKKCNSALKNKKRYFLMRDIARAYINGIVYKAIETADKDSLRIARRFSKNDRKIIYDNCVCNDKIKQLFDIDPVLAYIIVMLAEGEVRYPGIEKSYSNMPFTWMEVENELKGCSNTKEFGKECLEMVNHGAKLKDIYKKLNWPSASRKIKPGIFVSVCPPAKTIEIIKSLDNNFINAYIPNTTLKQQRWISALSFFEYKKHMLKWVGKHASTDTFLSDKKDEILTKLNILNDYIAAIELYDVRPFNHNMTYETVVRNSNLWHERHQEDMRRRNEEWQQARELEEAEFKTRKQRIFEEQINTVFPIWHLETWKYKDWTIEYIKNGKNLFKEGENLHHCVFDYFYLAKEGSSFFFSLKNKDKKEITIQLIKTENTSFIYSKENKYVIKQALGYNNRRPTEEEKEIYNKWISFVNKELKNAQR